MLWGEGGRRFNGAFNWLDSVFEILKCASLSSIYIVKTKRQLTDRLSI